MINNNSISNKIGFMQGRLSEIVDGKIQAFPWDSWEHELEIGPKYGFNLMEWTLDQHRINENPLMNTDGINKIVDLSKIYNIKIQSLTGDCFMQEPFWKSSGVKQASLINDFIKVCNNSQKIGINIIVIPLVDNGSIRSNLEEKILIEFLNDISNDLESKGLRICFESDFPPSKLASLIDKLKSDIFGINYDTGNSASFGFKASEEFKAYGEKIFNVHIKDRLYKGSTVPLLSGNVDFNSVMEELSNVKYKENFILQTARSSNGLHAEVLIKYKNIIKNYLDMYNIF